MARSTALPAPCSLSALTAAWRESNAATATTAPRPLFSQSGEELIAVALESSRSNWGRSDSNNAIASPKSVATTDR